MFKISEPIELTWEEKLKIRKHALECAARSRRSGYTSDQIVHVAKVFEKYLMGEDNG